MDINQAFPSKHLKAADLQGHSVEVVVTDVTMEDMGDGQKPVVYFQGKDKGLVLNKTNANFIMDSYGPLTEDWAGKTIVLYPDKTDFRGKIVDCIRVRVPQSAPLPPEDEEIPF